MALSDAKKRANKKWNDENLKEKYDRIQLVVPKGEKEKIQEHAKLIGKSVNGFINEAIQEKMQSYTTAIPAPIPKKESLSIMKDVPTVRKTPSKNISTQMVAGQIITDKMNNLRAENRIEEYIALANLFTTTPKSKADFIEEVKKTDFLSDVDEAINALLVFHRLKAGETG